MTIRHFQIHTDGACVGNPGPGGWACLIRIYTPGEAPVEHTDAGKDPATTNNRMELLAAIKAVHFAKKLNAGEHDLVTLSSDSQYVIKGITEYMPDWLARNWRTSSKKPVANQDLWVELLAVTKDFPKIDWRWVRGHNGDPDNEQVDQLANAQSRAA